MERYPTRFSNPNRFHQGYNKPAEKPKSKTGWILWAVLFIALSVLIYILISVANPEKISSEPDKDISGGLNNSQFSQSLISCKTWNCFIDASKNCEKANFTLTGSYDFFGLNTTATAYYELKDFENEQCIFYLRTEEMYIDFTDELIQQMIDSGSTFEEIEQTLQEANKEADLLEGKEGQCKIKNSDLVIFLTKSKQGSLSGGISCHSKLIPEGGNTTCDYSGDWELFNDCEGSYFNSEF